MNIRTLVFAATVALGTSSMMAAAAAPPADPPSWDARAAAAYLDGRADWWTTWPNAARDRGTFCISCHTTLPYAMARPALRGPLGESTRSAAEGKIVDNLLTRVRSWRDVEPFYPDQTRGIPKTSESRAIESVMNALVLVQRDAPSGRLSDDARAALGYMWALQMKVGPNAGAWTWLNFGYEPWESPNSPYLGASLAAMAAGSAPGAYAAQPELRDNVRMLREYFQRQFDRESTLNRLMALWASSKLEGLLTPPQRQTVVDAAYAAQREDGGWSTASLGSYKRVDDTPLDTASDGYATALVTHALQESGVPASEPRVAHGLEWLRRNQDRQTGTWRASSLNKQRDPASDPGKFMTDAATAYAVLSLTRAR
jgi:squalene-hopene/tetraprenyl-beta-curcumene cyclase